MTLSNCSQKVDLGVSPKGDKAQIKDSSVWPAAGFTGTELRCSMELEVKSFLVGKRINHDCIPNNG